MTKVDNPPSRKKTHTLLKGMALIGAGAALLPAQWVTPIVSSVIDQAEACSAIATPPFSLKCGSGGGNPPPPAPPPQPAPPPI